MAEAGLRGWLLGALLLHLVSPMLAATATLPLPPPGRGSCVGGCVAAAGRA